MAKTPTHRYGPVPVRQMTGVQVDVEELGGAQSTIGTGAASIVVPQDDVLQHQRHSALLAKSQ